MTLTDEERVVMNDSVCPNCGGLDSEHFEGCASLPKYEPDNYKLPERVALTDEEHDRIRFAQHDGLCPEGPDCRSRFPHSHSTTVTATLSPSLIAEFEHILAAREQALREEIAKLRLERGEWMARFDALADPDEHRATLHAARIAKGETR